MYRAKSDIPFPDVPESFRVVLASMDCIVSEGLITTSRNKQYYIVFQEKNQ